MRGFPELSGLKLGVNQIGASGAGSFAVTYEGSKKIGVFFICSGIESVLDFDY